MKTYKVYITVVSGMPLSLEGVEEIEVNQHFTTFTKAGQTLPERFIPTHLIKEITTYEEK